MAIRINKVKLFQGTRNKVISEFFQVLGMETGSKRIKVVEEGKSLDKILDVMKSNKIEWTPEERHAVHDVYIPKY